MTVRDANDDDASICTIINNALNLNKKKIYIVPYAPVGLFPVGLMVCSAGSGLGECL